MWRCATKPTDNKNTISELVAKTAPALLELCGVGPIIAATVICAWGQPGRIRNDAAFAMLAGTAPIPASSGVTNKHRLNRFGDRKLNSAIHIVAVTRLRSDLAHNRMRTDEKQKARVTATSAGASSDTSPENSSAPSNKPLDKHKSVQLCRR